MKIPFIQHTDIGLHITGRAIRWVQLSRIRDRISIDNVVYKEVNNTDHQVTLNNLVDKVQPSYPYVIANIPSKDVYQAVLELPFEDGEGYFAEWLNEAPKQFIPEEYEIDEFRVSHHLFGDDEQSQLCLFTLAHKKRIEDQIDLLNSVGLHPVALTAGNLQTGYGMMFDTDFVSGKTMLLKAFEDSCGLIEYHNGLAANFHALPQSGDFKELVEEAESVVVSRSVYEEGASTGAGEIYSAAADTIENTWDDPSRMKVHEVTPLSHLRFGDNQLPPDMAVACGMAVKAIYPALDSVNLMSDDNVKANKDAIEKKDAIITASVLGGAMLFLWILVSIVQWNLSTENQKLLSRISVMQDKITAVSEARKRVKKMKKTVSDARSVVSDQASMVQYLESIGRIFERGIWLQGLILEKTDPGIPAITLMGYAQNESSISKLLANLEKMEKIRKVQLVYSRKKKTEDIFSNNRYREKYVILYEIQVQTAG